MSAARLPSAAALLGAVCQLQQPDSVVVQAFIACGGQIRRPRSGPHRTLHADLCGLTGRHNHHPAKAIRHWLQQARRAGAGKEHQG